MGRGKLSKYLSFGLANFVGITLTDTLDTAFRMRICLIVQLRSSYIPRTMNLFFIIFSLCLID